jgi:hypothetical protein
MKTDFTVVYTTLKNPMFRDLKAGDAFTFPAANQLFLKLSIADQAVRVEDGHCFLFENEAVIYPRPSAIVLVNGKQD